MPIDTLSFLIAYLFAFGFGYAALYMGKERKQFGAIIISLVIFSTLTLASFDVPFKTDASENVVISTPNIILCGMSLICLFVSFLEAFVGSFQFFKQKISLK